MKKVIIKLIHFYQRAVSPYKGRSMCIYYPTCSQYALEAVEQYGALKGGWMAFKRILRCNPFAKGGYDPVPIVYKPKKGKPYASADCKTVQDDEIKQYHHAGGP